MSVYTRLSPTLLFFSLSVAVAAQVQAEDQIIINADPSAMTERSLSEEQLAVSQQPGGAYLIDGADLQQRKLTNVADALRYIPGVAVSSTNGATDVSMSVRGSGLDTKGYDRNGIRMLEDGLSITTADGRNHNRMFNPLSLKYATFYRGPNALEYGASVLGGVINVTSPNVYNSPRLQAGLTAGSFGLLQVRAAGGQDFANNVDYYLSADKVHSDGYRGHNQQDNQNISVNSGWEDDNFSTRFYLSYHDLNQEIPGSLSQNQIDSDSSLTNADAQRGDYQKDVKALRIANKSSYVFDHDSDKRLDFGVSAETQDMFHPIVAYAGPFFRGLLYEEAALDINTFLRYQHKITEHKIVYGINYGVSDESMETYDDLDGAVKGRHTKSADSDSRTLELYAVDRWQVSKRFNLQLAAQAATGERKTVEEDLLAPGTTRLDGDYSSINPRIGIIYDYDEQQSLYASIGRIYEPPTLNQLADQSSTTDGVLNAMHGMNLEFGGRGRIDGTQGQYFTWDVTVFRTWIEDEILSVEDPAAPGTAITGNADKTIHSGIETAFTSNVSISEHASLAAKLSATVNRFSFDGDSLYGDNDLPGAPRYYVQAEVLFKHDAAWYVGPTLDVVGSRYVDFANTYIADSYAVLGLLAGYQAESWRVFAELRNLLDTDSIVSTSISDQNVDDTSAVLNPGAPVSFYLGFERTW